MTTTDLARQSPLHRQHLSLKARLAEYALGLLPADYGDLATDTAQAVHLGLVDLCLMPRAGFKGAGAGHFLQQSSLALPGLPNRAEQQDNGLLVSQLSFDEYLLLDTTPAASAMITTLCNTGSLDEAPDCYQVPRQDSHGCLAVTGQAAWRTLAALISVDLRPHRFANFQIAQTLLNELSVIVIRCDQSLVPNYYLLVDITSIEFLWTVLLDAMAEAGGAPVGLNAFQTLEAAMDSGEASLVLG